MTKFLILLLSVMTFQLKGDLFWIQQDELDCTLKFRMAAFFPSSDRVRSIYGNAWPAYEMETTLGVYDFCQVWANLDWMNCHGHSEHLKNFTSMKMISFALGASLIGHVKEDLKIYVGAGYSFSHAWFHNRSTPVHKHPSTNISGVLFKSGILYDINCRFFTELFLDYLYQGQQFKTKVRFGGLKLGGGIGYKF